MIKKRQKTVFSVGPIGIASLIVCFSVLCLTVLAVSAFVAAKNELREAEAVAAARKDFYEADCIAAEYVRRLEAAWQSGESITDVADSIDAHISADGQITFVAFGVYVSDAQTLSVLLSFDTDMEILSWQVIPAAEWSPQDSISVWQS